ncbi:MAG TPA: TRAP transporter small permease [Clostridiaceae bacterium]|jgi:TRAP-type C4-dicarboxylate transport system permease small subunit|nr:TRAP transporter small permease [Clostridiaceae bacterium]
MRKFESVINKASKTLDALAGLGIVAVAFLVVLNVIMRAVFKNPILGTYEYAGFLTAIIVSFGLAWCAIQNGHIAIDIIIKRFSKWTQNVVDAVSNSIMTVLIGMSAWGLFSYAASLARSGEVSPTSQTPLFYFVFLSAISFMILDCTILVKAVRTIKEVVAVER